MHSPDSSSYDDVTPSLFARVAAFCHDRRRVVAGVWVLALVVIAGFSGALGDAYRDEFNLPASDSKTGFDVLDRDFGGQGAGGNGTIKEGTLRPTIAGRTLDVSSTGEAGMDWANIGSPTTTVNLSGTTVKTATDVETDTQDLQSRVPAALVSGRLDVTVGAGATVSTTTRGWEPGPAE